MKHINKVNYVDNAEEAIKSLIETDRNGNKVIKLSLIHI